MRESPCDQPDRRHTASAIFGFVQPAAREPLDRLGARHVVSLDEPTLARLAPHVAAIAEAEGLAAHAESVRMRRSP